MKKITTIITTTIATTTIATAFTKAAQKDIAATQKREADTIAAQESAKLKREQERKARLAARAKKKAAAKRRAAKTAYKKKEKKLISRINEIFYGEKIISIETKAGYSVEEKVWEQFDNIVDPDKKGALIYCTDNYEYVLITRPCCNLNKLKDSIWRLCSGIAPAWAKEYKISSPEKREEMKNFFAENGGDIIVNMDRTQNSCYQFDYEDSKMSKKLITKGIYSEYDIAQDAGLLPIKAYRWIADNTNLEINMDLHMELEPFFHINTRSMGSPYYVEGDVIAKFAVNVDFDQNVLGWIGSKHPETIKDIMSIVDEYPTSWEYLMDYSNFDIKLIADYINMSSYYYNIEEGANFFDILRVVKKNKFLHATNQPEIKIAKNIEGKKIIELAKELEVLFINKFRRAPRILSDIAIFNRYFRKDLTKEEIVNKFYLKAFQLLNKTHLTTNAKLRIIYVFKENAFEIANSGFNEQELRVLAHIKDEKCAEFVVKYKNRNFEKLQNIINSWEFFTKEEKTLDFNSLFRISKEKESINEVHRIERKYNIDFFSLKFNLKFSSIELDDQTAGILKPADTRMTTIGYDTYCCQHLNGAGESAMMYGLMHPHAGFWVVERTKDKKIIAQAEIWEGKNDAMSLVFDNIELADDRNITAIIPILKAWCQDSKYENIQMGLGYNALGEIVGQFCSRDEFIEQDCSEYSPYSDANDCRVWLKKGGVVVC